MALFLLPTPAAAAALGLLSPDLLAALRPDPDATPALAPPMLLAAPLPPTAECAARCCLIVAIWHRVPLRLPRHAACDRITPPPRCLPLPDVPLSPSSTRHNVLLCLRALHHSYCGFVHTRHTPQTHRRRAPDAHQTPLRVSRVVVEKRAQVATQRVDIAHFPRRFRGERERERGRQRQTEWRFLLSRAIAIPSSLFS